MPNQPDSLQLTTTATMANLPELLALADHACDAAQLDEQARHVVRLLVEEVCVNVISYGYPDSAPGPIELAMHWTAERMTVEVSDRAVAFSPGDLPQPDLEAGWEERSLGGLGWHLVRNLSDELEHTCLPAGGNRYTMVKHLRASPT